MNKSLIKKHEDFSKEHHIAHYNKSKFEWVWQTIDHIGIWAYGGCDQNIRPTIMRWVKFCVPKRNKNFGWFCYIGPEPNFLEEQIDTHNMVLLENNLICTSKSCPFTKDCANHETAGQFREEGGETPVVHKINGQYFCEKRTNGNNGMLVVSNGAVRFLNDSMRD